MIYSSTSLKTSDGDEISIGELLVYLKKNSPEFKEAKDILDRVQTLRARVYQFQDIVDKFVSDKVDPTDKRLDDARKPLPHTHVLKDITDFDAYATKNKKLIENVFEELSARIGKLPNKSKDLEPLIQNIKEEFANQLSVVTRAQSNDKTVFAANINKRFGTLDARYKELSDMLGETIDTAEENLRIERDKIIEQIQKLPINKSASGTGGGAGAIIGGVNPALNKLAKLKDVNASNLIDGYVLTYNAASKKFIFAPASGGGGGGETFAIQDADLILNDSNKNSVFNNKGASAITTFTIDAAASAGSSWEVEVGQDTAGIKVVAGGTRTIRLNATDSSAGGNIQSILKGAVAKLIVIDAAEIFVRYSTRTWTIT